MLQKIYARPKILSKRGQGKRLTADILFPINLLIYYSQWAITINMRVMIKYYKYSGTCQKNEKNIIDNIRPPTTSNNLLRISMKLIVYLHAIENNLYERLHCNKLVQEINFDYLKCNCMFNLCTRLRLWILIYALEFFSVWFLINTNARLPVPSENTVSWRYPSSGNARISYVCELFKK